LRFGGDLSLKALLSTQVLRCGFASTLLNELECSVWSAKVMFVELGKFKSSGWVVEFLNDSFEVEQRAISISPRLCDEDSGFFGNSSPAPLNGEFGEFPGTRQILGSMQRLRDTSEVLGRQRLNRLSVDADQSGHCHNVPCVVIDDSLQGAFIACAKEVRIAATDLTRRDIIDAFEAQDMRLDVTEAASTDSVAMNATSHVQQVQVRRFNGRWDAIHDEAGANQGHVERLTVEADEHGGRQDSIGYALKDGSFFTGGAQEQLFNDKATGVIEISEADKERQRTGAARQPRGFGV
jgi:hypothetical protein